jgi:S-adenosylmethionine decarboxylase
MHLVIDGFGADEAKLQDLALVFDLLDNYPAHIGMTKIMPPYVFRYTGVKPEDWGVSGVVLIAESHISIHTFPEKNYINIDVFSCKAFDAELALNFMKEKFGITNASSRVLERGLEYPHEIQRASSLVRMERLEVAVAGATQPT